MFLFDDPKHRKTDDAIVSPIRQHIEQIDAKLKARLVHEQVKKSKSYTSIENQNRYQRMKFMGIPAPNTKQVQKKDWQDIVGRISQTSILYRENSSSIAVDKMKHSLPQDVKLIPKIPEFDYTTKEKRELSRIDGFVPFSKAQPRGTNAKNLRVDKSLPWIQDELNATKVKLDRDCESGETFTVGTFETQAHMQPKGNLEENFSPIKLSYKEKIAEKLKSFKTKEIAETSKEVEVVVENKMQSDDELSSCLSSDGTYLTNDSGSFLIAADRKIPKSEMNLQEKFQVSQSDLKSLRSYS